MKRILALLLALCLLFCLAACRSEEISSETSGDVSKIQSVTESSSSENESTENLISSAEETSSSTSIPTSSETPSTTSKPANSSKPTNTSKPANTSSKPNTTTKPTTPSNNNQNTNNTDNNTPTSAFKEFKFVEKKLADPYITKNGQDLLTRLYGNDHTIQVGDSVTWEIVLSSGSLDKWEIVSFGGTYKLNGNKITVTADGSGDKLFVRVRLNDDYTIRYISNEYDVITDARGKITDSESAIEMELIRYTQRKGMKIASGADIWGYTWNPALGRCDENISITKNVDCGDDYIIIVGNSDWVDKAIWLIDEYNKMGVIRVSLTVNFQGGLSIAADTAESAKYLNR